MASQDRSASLPLPLATPAGPADSAPVLDPKIMLASVEQDLSLLRELAELFFAECPGLLSQIRNGVRESNPEAVERNAHTLKGALSNFGALAACNAARELEIRGREARFDGAPELLSSLEREVNRACNALSMFLQEASREGSAR
ncbi:MAG TPA: Hpt domain-containing protein [Patescibacteria group bacterium]|nr:Hpt domain-containing protein [Patescibacteria group bacterium]